MRGLNYLRNKIEFAANGNGKITVDKNLVNALNEIIDFVNGKPQNTDSEDALLLFYLLQVWKIDNEKNKLKIEQNRTGIFTLSDPFLTLESLLMSARPKENVLDELYTEMRVYQLRNKLPKDDLIKKKDLRQLIDSLLSDVKNFKSFQQIKTKKLNYDSANKS